MNDETRYVAGGAAVGAIVGALAAWAYRRYLGPARPAGQPEARVPLDRSKVLRLGWAVIALVRQVLELG